MALSASQRALLRQITAEGGQVIKDPRIRRIADRAAAQTALVESNIANLPGGDADSQGWRQERASLYPNPRNVKASARRFYQEFLQKYDPGEHSWDVAAQVQRPAAQYRDRYRQRAGDAEKALREIGGGSSGGSVSSQGDRNPQTQTKTTVTGAGFDPGPGVSALAQLAQQQARPTVQTTVPTPPQFAASAAMPQGYQAPSAAPVQQQSSGLTELLSQLGAGGQSLPQVDVKTETSTSSSGGSSNGLSSGSSGGSRKGLKGDFGGQLKELFYNGPGGVNVDNGKRVPKGFVSGHTDHVHVAAGPKTVKTLARLAQDMGLTVRELAPFDKVDPVHTSGSYHYRKQAADISGDPRKMAEYSRRVARIYGIKA